MQGRTVLFVAHRVETLAIAHQVVALEMGRWHTA
jgi:ABC-type transport system involved in Fe-S cluster assembly fused permease/ATPase subunit